ncbi:MAG TPA: fructosamine kinase family protein, partial [Polyangia bacterium]
MGSLAPAVVAAMESVLGAPIAEARSVAGGDINQAWAITTGAGDRLFAKTNPRAAAGMFAAEAKGLTWLAEAGCLRVPRVLGQGDGEGARFLLLEMITSSARRRDHDELFGRGLAALHRFGAAGFGLDHDNFIGDVPQKNQPVAAEVTWAGFYRSHRLQPMLARADKRGLVNVGLRRRFDELFDRLPELAGPE